LKEIPAPIRKPHQLSKVITSLLKPKEQKKFLSKLLAWYKLDGRHDMPWRKTKDPYAIFVSEFMLQQTTVSTVRPYYERFLKRFPTISSLAKADLNDVLALWSGLGYYARARNLWASMKIVEDDFDGVIPSDLQALLKLPGVGYYTAGAVSSLAFHRPVPVLDGNITRVMMRLFAMQEDPRLKAVQVILRKTMTDLLSHVIGPQVKDAVLAFMDLGASLCSPQNAKCLICPVSEFCLAKKNGYQDQIPFREERMERPTVRRHYSMIIHKGKWLVAQRPKEGLFGGLWEFPGFDAPPGINPVDFLEDRVREDFGLKIRVNEALPAFDHHLTHKIMAIRSFISKLKGKYTSLPRNPKNYTSCRWVKPHSLNRFGISSVTRKIISLITRDNVMSDQ